MKLFNDRMSAKNRPQPVCPMCGHDAWNLLDGINLGPYKDWGEDKQPKSLPTIPLICGHCAFVAHFAAGSYGLIEEK